MLMEERRVGEIMVVEVLDQRLDAKVAVEFKDRMGQIIKGGNQSLVIALDKVDFIDSSGLGAIVSSLKALGPDGDMAICGTKDAVRSLFKLTRMDKVFKMFTSEEEAVSALGN